MGGDVTILDGNLPQLRAYSLIWEATAMAMQF
jgi:hypothetical protein